jgi:hypothetical protein
MEDQTKMPIEEAAKRGRAHSIKHRELFRASVPRAAIGRCATLGSTPTRRPIQADQASLAEPARFKSYVAALRKVELVVYAKRPFGGPGAVLAYLSRYTHRVATANSRLVAFDGERVTFKWKDYRAKADARYKLMTINADEFIRRFLIHVLPGGFHRIRHYGLFANANRAANIALARELLGVPDPALSSEEGGGVEDGLEHEESNACPC